MLTAYLIPTTWNELHGVWKAIIIIGEIIVAITILYQALGLRFIPNNTVGIVEKLWSPSGSIQQGQLISLGDEAGFQADVLRGGFHFWLWRWQYRLHTTAVNIFRGRKPLKNQCF